MLVRLVFVAYFGSPFLDKMDFLSGPLSLGRGRFGWRG